MDTRDKISHLERQIDRLKRNLQHAQEHHDYDEMERIDIDLHEAEEQFNFACQDDEIELNYAIESQEFNPDGSLKYYD